MNQNSLFATLENFTKLARWMDEIDEDPNPEKDDTVLTANVAVVAPIDNKFPPSHYDPTNGDTTGAPEPTIPLFNVGMNPGGRGPNSGGGRGNNRGRGRGGYRGNNYNPHYHSEKGYKPNNPVTTPTQSLPNGPKPRKNNNFVVPMPNNPHKNLTYEIEPNGNHGWFINGERIAEQGGAGQPFGNGNQGARRDDVRDSGNNNHLSANLAIEVINDIITPFVYTASYYSLRAYISYLVQALVALVLIFKNSFFSKDLIGALYKLNA